MSDERVTENGLSIILKIQCEICWTHIGNTTVGRLKEPFRGDMFDSPDEFHGYPVPFPPEVSWEDMRCLYCFKRPFIEEGRFWLMDGSYYDVRKLAVLKELMESGVAGGIPQQMEWLPDGDKKVIEVYRYDVAIDECVSGGQEVEVKEVKSGFACLECGKVCGSPWRLKMHQKTHNKKERILV